MSQMLQISQKSKMLQIQIWQMLQVMQMLQNVGKIAKKFVWRPHAASSVMGRTKDKNRSLFSHKDNIHQNLSYSMTSS